MDAVADSASSACSETRPADFLVRLAQALHNQGMACHHLESLLGRVAERLNLKAHMLSLPTAFLVSFDERAGSGQHSVIVRMDPGSMDLYRQSKLIVPAPWARRPGA